MKKTNKQPKIKNRVARSRALYSTAMIAILLVAAVALNVLFTVVGDRLHLSWDLSTGGAFSISAENIKYIEDVEREVNVIVCATEEDYVGDYFSQYAAYYYTTEDSTGKYYSQTVSLLKKYEGYNKNIDVKFIDPQSTEFSDIAKKYSTESLLYGDIIVDCDFIGSDGKKISRHKILTFNDIYEKTDESGYASQGFGSYSIGSNNIETQLTSAIYYVTSEETTKIGLIESHCEPAFTQNYVATLALNNYEVVSITDPIITEKSIPEDIDALIIGGVTSDFTLAELEVIETFLLNGMDRGRGLVFFANTSSPSLPNLYGYLEEWGISVGSGILYETTEDYVYQSNTNMMLANLETDHTADVNAKNGVYLAGNLVPLETAFQRYGSRQVSVLMQSSSTVVIAPNGISPTWKPDDTYAAKARNVAILAKDTSYETNADGISSYVIAFASTDFVSSTWSQYPNVLNMDMSLCAANIATGNSGAKISFTAKAIDTTSFADQVTASKANTIQVIFVWVVPLLILALCVVVYIRRKNR